MQAQVARTHVRTHDFGRKEPKMDDDLKDLIERMSALLALVVTIGALVYALWKTVQLAGISF